MEVAAKVRITTKICEDENLNLETFRMEQVEKVFSDAGRPDILLISVSAQRYQYPYRPFTGVYKVSIDGRYCEPEENSFIQKKKQKVASSNPMDF